MDNRATPFRYAIGAALMCGLIAGMLGVDVTTRLESGDGWRRTAHGWERSDRWSSTTGTTQSSEPPPTFYKRFAQNGRRSDAHPAALALVQLVGSMLALAVFSPRGRSMLSQTPLSTILARSFRASVFGS